MYNQTRILREEQNALFSYRAYLLMRFTMRSWDQKLRVSQLYSLSYAENICREALISRASDNYSAPFGVATNLTVNSEKVKTKGKIPTSPPISKTRKKGSYWTKITALVNLSPRNCFDTPPQMRTTEGSSAAPL
ncbi:uncharacterized protein ZBAI_03771 [Zygosaccharomyces bailii ISA1307]|nr:uncharacterized protein ZBAI_03771 [Zygosaccharomyces bailii ISA1307]